MKPKETINERWVPRRPFLVFFLAAIILTAAAGFGGALLLRPAEHAGDTAPRSFVPEYDRFLSKVVISLSAREPTLALHHNILMALPEYSRVLVLLSQKILPAIEKELTGKKYESRTQLIPFPVKTERHMRYYFVFPERDKLVLSHVEEPSTIPRGTDWAQDLFEVILKSDGSATLIVSDVYKWFASRDDNLSVVSDNAFVTSLSSAEIEVVRSAVTFSGGNVLYDVHRGSKVVFCGGDLLRKTRTVWKATRDSVPSDSQIVAMLKKDLDADEVVIIGSDRVQPTQMFHLDQAMVLLPHGTVAVTRIVDGNTGDHSTRAEIKDVQVFLSQLRSKLQQMGYKIIDLYTSAQYILDYKHYANAIPYIDRTTGRRTILMPVFGQGGTGAELEEKNVAALESAGYRVIRVRTEAHQRNGGIHCLINVLQ